MIDFYQSAAKFISDLKSRKISSVELVQNTISRIELLDIEINAVVVRDFQTALESAKKADEAIANGDDKPLLGLPITVKESFNVSGLTTSWANPRFKSWMPDTDSLIIHRLKKAGAIIIGKTNVPFMLKDWQAYNDLYGTTNNPWNLKRTSGGSSGGSAAALASGLTSLELGSDLAGSLRVPAHFCGVCTHKPSIDLVPSRGSGPPGSLFSPNPASDLVTYGPMARHIKDLKIMFDVIKGPDEQWNGKGYQLNLPKPRHDSLGGFKVLILDQHPSCPTSNTVKKAIQDLSAKLKTAHVTVAGSDTSMPNLAEVTNNYLTLMTSFSGANMPQEMYDDMSQAKKSLDPNHNGQAAHLLQGYTASHREWHAAIRKRNALRQQFRSLFSKYDVIICPVMPTTAFSHDHSDPRQRMIEIDGKKYPYHVQYAWSSIATSFGLPATVIPIDYSSGLPVGIQIIGDYLEDNTTLQLAELLENEFFGFQKPNAE